MCGATMIRWMDEKIFDGKIKNGNECNSSVKTCRAQ